MIEQGLADGAGGVGGEPPERLVGIPVRAQQIRPEMPDDAVLLGRGHELDDREPEARRPRDRRSSGRRAPDGPGRRGAQRPGGRRARSRPSAGGCAASGPLENRNSWCLPRETTSSTFSPVRSAVACCGTRKSDFTNSLPASASCRRRQASQTVSPSGTGGLRPQPRNRRPRGVAWNPAVSRARPSGDESTDSPSARCDREPAQSPVPDGQRERVDGCLQRVVARGGPGQQRLAAPLDVEDELTLHEDDERAGLAARLVSRRDLAGALRPRQGRTVRVRRVGGGEDQGPRATRRTAPPEPLDGACPGAKARSRSTAPATANWAAPNPSTK